MPTHAHTLAALTARATLFPQPKIVHPGAKDTPKVDDPTFNVLPPRTLAAPRRLELVARAAADTVVQLGNGDGSGGLES